MSIFTLRLLRTIASNGAKDCVFLAPNAIFSTLCISLGLGRLDLGFTGSMLLLSRLLPRSTSSHLPNALNNVTLRGMYLAGCFTKAMPLSTVYQSPIEALSTYLGSPEPMFRVDDVVLEDINCF